jgi:erythronate-4-phosphate dehydrogenase
MNTLVIDDHIPFIKGVLEPFAKVIYARNGLIDRNMAMQADGLIIRTRTRCDEGLLKGTPVRFIATATIGFDHIDTSYCHEQNISWHHAPGCNSSSVKQYIASVLLNLHLMHEFDLTGKKIGIIGVGHVGQKVVQLAQILGMIPLLNDPPRERSEAATGFVSIEEIMETSDIITFHVPLNLTGINKTFHLADEYFFERLAKKPVIINSSRGAVVETKAVKNALITGKISGLCADVWENEPHLDHELLEKTAIATPHIAGYSVEGKANGTAMCVMAASRFFGFGLENWHPSFLPPPANPVIFTDLKNKSKEQVIAEAILATYDVMKDDAAFRKDPLQFENLRNSYPVRREFEAYSLHVPYPIPDLLQTLQSIGFKTHTKD